ncbi:unnamed protein product, partial [Nesidiocoris tenuis]
VIMGDRPAAERACKDPNPIIDGRKANVNLAILGAKPRGNLQPSLTFPGLRAGYPTVLPAQYGSDYAWLAERRVPPGYSVYQSPYLAAAAAAAATGAAATPSGLMTLQHAAPLSHAAAVAAAASQFYEYQNAAAVAAAAAAASSYPSAAAAAASHKHSSRLRNSVHVRNAAAPSRSSDRHGGVVVPLPVTVRSGSRRPSRHSSGGSPPVIAVAAGDRLR